MEKATSSIVTSDTEMAQVRAIAFMLSDVERAVGIENTHGLPLSARISAVLEMAVNRPITHESYALLYLLSDQRT